MVTSTKQSLVTYLRKFLSLDLGNWSISMETGESCCLKWSFSFTLCEIPWRFSSILPNVKISWHFVKFPDNFLTLRKFISPWHFPNGYEHYNDVIMSAITSQITSLTIVYSIVYSDTDQRKLQSSASLAFVRGIHRGPVNSWPVTRKMFPFDDGIMNSGIGLGRHEAMWHNGNFNGSCAVPCCTWWRHQMETFSALPVPGEFPTQRPVTRSFDGYFDLRPNKRLSKQSWGWWFETLPRPLWRHSNGVTGVIELRHFSTIHSYVPCWMRLFFFHSSAC